MTRTAHTAPITDSSPGTHVLVRNGLKSRTQGPLLQSCCRATEPSVPNTLKTPHSPDSKAHNAHQAQARARTHTHQHSHVGASCGRTAPTHHAAHGCHSSPAASTLTSPKQPRSQPPVEALQQQAMQTAPADACCATPYTPVPLCTSTPPHMYNCAREHTLQRKAACLHRCHRGSTVPQRGRHTPKLFPVTLLHGTARLV